MFFRPTVDMIERNWTFIYIYIESIDSNGLDFYITVMQDWLVSTRLGDRGSVSRDCVVTQDAVCQKKKKKLSHFPVHVLVWK